MLLWRAKSQSFVVWGKLERYLYELEASTLLARCLLFDLLTLIRLGLAEGYLGSDGPNREKFVGNFFLSNPNVWMERETEDFDASGHKEPWRDFWRGPRDRLYRSGDLGRYLDSGDVECTGR